MIKLSSRFLLIAVGLITIVSADCSKEEVIKLKSKDFSEKEIKSICGDSKDKSINLQWIKLNKKICIEHGGEIKYGICTSNWSNANKICSVAGGRLASRLEFKKSILKCGGMIDEYDKNMQNNAYQSCTLGEGFSSFYDYWASTTCGVSKEDAWVAYLGSGNIYTYSKDGKSYVRCVKDEQ